MSEKAGKGVSESVTLDKTSRRCFDSEAPRIPPCSSCASLCVLEAPRNVLTRHSAIGGAASPSNVAALALNSQHTSSLPHMLALHILSRSHMKDGHMLRGRIDPRS